MDTNVRDNLVNTIKSANKILQPDNSNRLSPDQIYLGYAFEQLAKDLSRATKPLHVSYADLDVFDKALRAARNEGSKPFGVDINVGKVKYVEELYKAFNAAVDKGLLVTQDTARGRING